MNKTLNIITMKKLKKLSRNQLKAFSGGKSCATSCADGSIAFIDTCTECIQGYQGNAVVCYNSHEKAVYMEKCVGQYA
ncbi:hypothetical protein VO54_00760 [Elizabethkingia miricola]|nr:hypothetical protein VO54_00760 [Elizabethkingia miricola]BBQ09076.1 hypothetical protein JUNP353_3647 [Elizabethkingia anophelis]